MRIVVTGGTGFIGSHLVDRLDARGDDIRLWNRPGRSQPAAFADSAIQPSPLEGRAFAIDLLDPMAVQEELKIFQPDAIIHFAAQSLPDVSWKQPWQTLEFNVKSTLTLFDAARELQFKGPILVASSSSIYAPQNDSGAPIAEDHPLGATSPYATSKVAVDQFAYLYHKRYGLPVIRVRPFFWIGTRKTGDFCSDMAHRLLQAQQHNLDCIKTGNLDAVRDLLDVRDGVEAMLTLLERGKPGEAYNVCSGEGRKLRDILGLYMRMMPKPLRAETDPALLRPLDEPVRVGDPRKMMSLGWRPLRPLHETLKDIVEFWKEKAE